MTFWEPKGKLTRTEIIPLIGGIGSILFMCYLIYKIWEGSV